MQDASREFKQSESQQLISQHETREKRGMRDENEQVSKEGQEVKKRDNGQQLKLEMPSHMEMNSNEQPLDIEFKKY